MEASTMHPDRDIEEEYILFDLGDVSLLDIPPNAPYVLSGLDTLNPVLTICNKFKMIGEYQETIGTCLTFSEEDVSAPEEETGPSQPNRLDQNQASRKELKPIACVHKILKFRLLPESPIPSSTDGHTRDGAENARTAAIIVCLKALDIGSVIDEKIVKIEQEATNNPDDRMYT